jgi:hypothetical protein
MFNRLMTTLASAPLALGTSFEVGVQTYTKFVTDKDGRIDYWISDDFLPIEIFQPMRGLKSLGMLKSLGSAFIAVLFLTLAIWIGGAIARRRIRTELVLTRHQFRWRLASRVGVILLLLVLAGWFWVNGSVFASAGGNVNGYFVALYVLGALAAIGALEIFIEAALHVVPLPGGWLVRLGEVVLGLCGLYAL